MVETSDTPLVRREPATREELAELVPGGTLFAMVDACDSPTVYPRVKKLGDLRAVCAYPPKLSVDRCETAPYLVRVDASVFEWIVAELWQEPWGFFAAAATGLHELRDHFRQFTHAAVPGSGRVLFRYYDPRVLTAYLESSNRSELMSFFGPVRRFVVGGEWGLREVLWQFARPGFGGSAGC